MSPRRLIACGALLVVAVAPKAKLSPVAASAEHAPTEVATGPQSDDSTSAAQVATGAMKVFEGMQDTAPQSDDSTGDQSDDSTGDRPLSTELSPVAASAEHAPTEVATGAMKDLKATTRRAPQSDDSTGDQSDDSTGDRPLSTSIEDPGPYLVASTDAEDPYGAEAARQNCSEKRVEKTKAMTYSAELQKEARRQQMLASQEAKFAQKKRKFRLEENRLTTETEAQAALDDGVKKRLLEADEHVLRVEREKKEELDRLKGELKTAERAFRTRLNANTHLEETNALYRRRKVRMDQLALSNDGQFDDLSVEICDQLSELDLADVARAKRLAKLIEKMKWPKELLSKLTKFESDQEAPNTIRATRDRLASLLE